MAGKATTTAGTANEPDPTDARLHYRVRVGVWP
jgi:hypothetical protein